MVKNMSRRQRVFNGEELISETYRDVSWKALRKKRNSYLRKTDRYLIIDRPLSDETKEAITTYRQLLRDLPQTFPNDDNANDAYDNFPPMPEVD